MVTIKGNPAPRSRMSSLLYGLAAALVAAALSLTLLLRGTGIGTGNTYYVSPSGSDSKPCTQASPCATPDYAVNNKASAGDTVQVAAGTYDYGSGAAQFTKSGAAGKYITVTCATRGACKIQNSSTGNTTVIEIDSNYFRFDGFEVTNTSAAANNMGIYVTSSFVNVTRNKIHHIEIDCGPNGGGGIVTAGSGSVAGTGHDITIDSNLIYDIGWPDGGSPKCPSSTVQTDGIITESSGSNLVFTNNIVYHVSGGWGIAAGTTPGPPVVIANNLVFSNSNGGIIVTNDGGGTIANNTVLNNGVVAAQCGIMTAPGVSFNFANNDLWNNNGGSYCVYWGGNNDQSVHSDDISVDPALGTTFVSWKADGSGDYHQKAGSPTIDKGYSGTGAPSIDFDGNPRPQGAGYDIGAYQSRN